MRLLLILLTAAIGGYVVYLNAKANPQYTNIDGWQRTARDRRPDMPPPPEMVDEMRSAAATANSG